MSYKVKGGKDEEGKGMKKGYCGIGIFNPKTTINMGTLWRSAHLFGVDFIFTIGERYKRQPTDTLKSFRHVPLFNFKDWEDFIQHIPMKGEIVIVEQSESHQLGEFAHPKQAIYVLGAEDYGIPEKYWKGHLVVNIPTEQISSLNVAVAGSIVLYDRYIQIKKMRRKEK